MKRRPLVINLPDWKHNPVIRKARFRCQGCAKVIQDGSHVIVEVRPGGSHGYHVECFTGVNREAVEARNAEHMERR